MQKYCNGPIYTWQIRTNIPWLCTSITRLNIGQSTRLWVASLKTSDPTPKSHKEVPSQKLKPCFTVSSLSIKTRRKRFQRIQWWIRTGAIARFSYQHLQKYNQTMHIWSSVYQDMGSSTNPYGPKGIHHSLFPQPNIPKPYSLPLVLLAINANKINYRW